MNGIFHVNGTVKNYDWGGFFFLSALLKQENKNKQPFAEYWIGTHPLGPSQLVLPDGDTMPLQIKSGELPFLLKLLDVREMLSIQVHPSKEAARIEFDREEAEGIPLDSPKRNYKDRNHKPELMVALGEFWLLHGFKPVEELHDILINITELNELVPLFNNKGYEGLYRHVMEMPQSDVNRILNPLLDKILSSYNDGKLDKSTEDFWAARAAQQYSKEGNIDRGIFSIYLFNLLKLQKGEGIFQGAGVPHAYLEGQNVEIMASSDNVLRGGLTNKHVDVKELMKHVRCEATFPGIIYPLGQGQEKLYECPVTEFRLSNLELNAGEKLGINAESTEILLMAHGNVRLKDAENDILLNPGNISAAVIPNNTVQVVAIENSLLFRVR